MAPKKTNPPLVNKCLPQTKSKAARPTPSLTAFAKDTVLKNNKDKAAGPVTYRLVANAASAVTAPENQARRTQSLASRTDNESIILETWFDACNATADNKMVSTDASKQKKGGDEIIFTVW